MKIDKSDFEEWQNTPIPYAAKTIITSGGSRQRLRLYTYPGKQRFTVMLSETTVFDGANFEIAAERFNLIAGE